MAFKVHARTLLHLGAELISSDAVAFYELIKNSFDAKSSQVRIHVIVRCPKANELQRKLEIQHKSTSGLDHQYLKALLAEAHNSLDASAPGIEEMAGQFEECSTFEQAVRALRSANYVEISDDGDGMSLGDLREMYLTIGTRNRLVEKQQLQERKTSVDGRPILGEKGVGRLSAMRLGMLLDITTSREGEAYWNKLNVDWDWFAEALDQQVGDIPVEPKRGKAKEKASDHGTTLRISSLKEKWDFSKLEQIAKSEAAKFVDPFDPERGFKVWLRFNGEPVPIPKLDKTLFKHAHAFVEAKFEQSRTGEIWEPVLSGSVDYPLGKQSKSFSAKGEHLLSAAGPPDGPPADEASVRALGPFTVKFYWFNRQALEALEDVGLGDREQARKMVNQWSGGLMLFRDGFRVIPYGNADDDWLDLDRKALASQGYKVNRKQLIGKVEISSRDNPALIDQTNREGLCQSEEKQVLVNLLKHILEVQFRAYITNLDKEIKARKPVDLVELRDRALSERKRAKAAIKLLVTRFAAVKKDPDIVPILEESIDKITEAMQELERTAKNLRDAKTEVIHLAAQGMLVEIIAHELWRATTHALATVAAMAGDSSQAKSPSMFRTLAAQLKTLQKRLQILDPVNTTARQVKTTFNLSELLTDIIQSHEPQFERHEIDVRFHLEPKHAKLFEVKMVRGMVIQVLENLLSNSVYWLKAKHRRKPSFKPMIEVILDTSERELRVTDNGPGVSPEQREEIFAPFITTKPAGEGKGLGLYIASEIAKYHGGELFLDEHTNPDSGNLNTFILRLPAP